MKKSTDYDERESYATELEAKIPFYLLVQNVLYYVGEGCYCGASSSGDNAINFERGDTSICGNPDYGAGVLKVSSFLKKEYGNDYQYLYNSEENAYPQNSIVDGYMYYFLGIPFEKIPSGACVTYGTYWGTGDLRSETDHHILTFTFNPILVVLSFLSGDEISVQHFYYPLERGDRYSYYGSSQEYYSIVKWGKKKISWYENYETMFNRNGTEYKYIAIGY